MKNKELLKFILEIYFKLEKESSFIYKTILEPLLQETSHSFGFKPYSDLNNYIIEEIERIHKNEDFSYYLFNQVSRKKSYKIIYKEIKNNEKNEDKTEYLNLILNILKQLYIISEKTSYLFAHTLSENEDNVSQKFGLSNTDKIIEFIENKLEQEIFLSIHGGKEGIEEQSYIDYRGFFFWFCFENKFGKKRLGIEVNDKKIIIKNNKDFIKLLLILEKNK
jgi:hypothetical protein